ncbi:MAG: putative 3-oxoacyl-acyl carrier protein reductase [Acidobacteria bacterium]|nr:putative 3-oxoacyl-acyl carrier protein reductase [Acidobacteriota bacterium]
MIPNPGLSGKIALINGIGQPFANAVATRFAELGATLALVYEPADAEAAHAFTAPQPAMLLECNGSDPRAVKTTVRAVAAALGGIDILVCASYARTASSLSDMSFEEWKAGIDGNLCRTLYFDREVIRPMMRKHEGRIINVLFSLTGAPAAVAARGIASLTRALASEVGTYGIYVNSIAVGQLQELSGSNQALSQSLSILVQESSPLGRNGRASEAAEVAAFLASSSGNLTSGHTLPASGGVYP